MQKVILDGIATVRAAGKAAGILAVDPALAQLFSAGASKATAASSGGY